MGVALAGLFLYPLASVCRATATTCNGSRSTRLKPSPPSCWWPARWSGVPGAARLSGRRGALRLVDRSAPAGIVRNCGGGAGAPARITDSALGARRREVDGVRRRSRPRGRGVPVPARDDSKGHPRPARRPVTNRDRRSAASDLGGRQGADRRRGPSACEHAPGIPIALHLGSGISFRRAVVRVPLRRP